MVSCSEKLMEKPDDLIAKKEMADILFDLAVINAVKSTDIAILRDNNIDPTEYVFTKYGIDSVQFVESDRYYASIPSEYKAIYESVESKLEKEQKLLEDAKKVRDSIKTAKFKLEKAKKKSPIKKIKDSL